MYSYQFYLFFWSVVCLHTAYAYICTMLLLLITSASVASQLFT
jgi:hypothetical protein